MPYQSKVHCVLTTAEPSCVHTVSIRHLDLQATRAYLHAEADVEKALNEAGFTVTKREMTATSFYFSRLLEAKRQK